MLLIGGGLLMTAETLHEGLISPHVTAAPAQCCQLAAPIHRVISVYLPVALLDIHF